jgi:hypothetical protein
LDIRLEKRIAPRRNTMIHSTIYYDGGRGKAPCIIRNLSASGAKIEVLDGSVANIPRTFDLVVAQLRPQGCTVVWRSLRELGVQFYDAGLN